MIPGVTVSELQPHDLSSLASLCLTARGEAALGAQVCVGDHDALRQQLATYAELDGTHVLVAHHEDSLVGFALLRNVLPGVFLTTPMLYLEVMYVAEGARRRGIGHALMSAVTDVAVTANAQEIYALPLPGSRGMQRFYSRLGFAPAASHRVATTQALLRHLAAETKRTRRGTTPLEDIIARRRRARIETNSGPLDMRAFQAAYAQENPLSIPPNGESSVEKHAR